MHTIDQFFFLFTSDKQLLSFFIWRCIYTLLCVYFFDVRVQPPLGWKPKWGLPNLEGAIAFYRLFSHLFGAYIFSLSINHTYTWIQNMLDYQNKLPREYFSESKYYGIKYTLKSQPTQETKGVRIIPILSVFYGPLNLANNYFNPIYFLRYFSD